LGGFVISGGNCPKQLLDANLLTDIRNPQKINAVISNGRLFDRKALDKMLSQVEGNVNPQ
jgi:hypothetical protein